MPKRAPRPGDPQVVDVLAPTGPPVVDPEPEPRPVAVAVVARPAPESQLSPEQRRIRELENQLALERGKKDPEPELEPPTAPGAADNVLIHFLEDGFTALGAVWFRGQELEFTPDSSAYRDTCDRYGNSWLDLRNDEFAQVERFGKVMFRTGPWPGKTYLDAAGFEPLRPLRADSGKVAAPTEDELTRAQHAEANRRRAAPRLPVH